jgi:hypothetical protein
MIIRHMHKCDAEYLRTDPVKETFQGQTVWEGDVEVFTVTGHPKAKHVYAWSYDKGERTETFKAVLEVPPVKSALDAVRVSILADKQRREK